MNLEQIRKDFPILENRKIAYLDNRSDDSETKTSNQGDRRILPKL